MTLTTTKSTRPLGDPGPEVSAVGIGTWALGGPFTFDGRDAGWGDVDDAQSVRALHVAVDAGVTLIDTAPTYGTGHSERVIGRALAALPRTQRDAVVVATKFGLVIDEEHRTGGGSDVGLGLLWVSLVAAVTCSSAPWWLPVSTEERSSVSVSHACGSGDDHRVGSRLRCP
jgi:aryl-alcohol dehydrogenase-like predicted oxidoreductase